MTNPKDLLNALDRADSDVADTVVADIALTLYERGWREDVVKNAPAVYKACRDRSDELRVEVIKSYRDVIARTADPREARVASAAVLSRLDRVVKAADGVVEGMLMYGKPVMAEDGSIKGDLDGKGFLGAMRDLQGEHDRFFMWVAGNRAGRLMKEDREHLFTNDEVEAMMKLIAGIAREVRVRVCVIPDFVSREQCPSYQRRVALDEFPGQE